MTKAGLISLTESLAAEVKAHGIDVNCICPGGVDTEGFREAFGGRGRAENPKLILPDEIAAVAVFLASDASSAITGTAIDAFGGDEPAVWVGVASPNEFRSPHPHMERKYREMKVVVFGAAGWTGRSVLANLTGKHQVRAFDRGPRGLGDVEGDRR